MKIQLKKNQENPQLQVLQILSQVLKLTNTEIPVLLHFINKYHSLSNVPEPHKSKITFDSDSRKEAKTNLNLTESHFNFLFGAIKKKGYIKDIKGVYKISPLLLSINSPTSTITIELV